MWTGSLPPELCSLSSLSAISIWSGSSSDNTLIRCTQSCLSTKIGMEVAATLPQCTNSLTSAPSSLPTGQPSCSPSSRPSHRPSHQPTTEPSGHPSGRPSGQPTTLPTDRPSSLPTHRPTNEPSLRPSGQPSSDRFLTAISTGTQTALCDFIAATNIATISGYSAWSCTAAHAVVTQPCSAATPVWAGVTACSTSGDVVAITLYALGISGESATNACGHHD